MKKYILPVLVIAMFTVYALIQRGGLGGEDDVRVVKPSNLAENTPAATAASTANPTANPTRTPAPTATPKGKYRDGTYTSAVADAYYGNVQLKIIISGGAITDVQFLQYPNDRSTSREINSQAMPYLTQEAIQAQSANVDGVSGATETSRAFIEALSGVLSQVANS